MQMYERYEPANEKMARRKKKSGAILLGKQRRLKEGKVILFRGRHVG